MTHPELIERITRSLAYMLRHQPEQFDLELDEYGFADMEDVIQALNERLGEPVEEEDVRVAVESGDRVRYEIASGRIRALYGHSIEVKPGESAKPPTLLYVGVSKGDAERARKYGLRPGRRSFLHLALNPDDALETGRRASRDYVVITVHALDAWEEGINFYDRKSLFLSDPIPTQFLQVGDVHTDGYGMFDGPRSHGQDSEGPPRDRERPRDDRGGRERGGRRRRGRRMGGRPDEGGAPRHAEHAGASSRAEAPGAERRTFDDERGRHEEPRARYADDAHGRQGHEGRPPMDGGHGRRGPDDRRPRHEPRGRDAHDDRRRDRPRESRPEAGTRDRQDAPPRERHDRDDRAARPDRGPDRAPAPPPERRPRPAPSEAADSTGFGSGVFEAQKPPVRPPAPLPREKPAAEKPRETPRPQQGDSSSFGAGIE